MSQFTISYLSMVIALLALIAAIYSVVYTHYRNRRRLAVDNCMVENEEDVPQLFLTVHNISPTAITILDIRFYEGHREITPLQYHEPLQTYSEGPYGLKCRDLIPAYKYASHLNPPEILQPYNSVELSYYFPNIGSDISITICCQERVHKLRRYQQFSFRV